MAEDEANTPFVPKLSPDQQMSHSNECKIASQKRERESQGPRRTSLYYPRVTLHQQIAVSFEAGFRLGRAVACSGSTSAFGFDEKTVHLTSSHKYVFAVAYKQHRDFDNFQQNNLNNNQYYDKFNTRVTVAKAIGIAWADPACLNWVIENVEPFKAAHAGTDYEDLDKDIRALVRDKAEELYLGYVMTIQSAAVNDKLKTDMHNNFTVGTNIYPGSPQASLHLLDKYLKQVTVQPVQPQGHSFAQGGCGSGRGGGPRQRPRPR